VVAALIKPPWEFPMMLHFWGRSVYIHQVTDLIAYTFGFRYYLHLKKKWHVARFSMETNSWLIIGCLFGALLGSKVLAWAEAPLYYWQIRDNPLFWFGGKTIVGGLLGGWLGIEIVKKLNRITVSTGDPCVFPLIAGIAIGRIGCFVTGLEDNTCGVATRLPWGVDFGDGIPRHPAQVYEILFLIALAVILWRSRSHGRGNGRLFRWFMGAYLGFRFLVEFIKPRMTPFLGLSSIQWACLIGVGFCIYFLTRSSERKTNPAHT
jgi:phosphatidylglycerol---prolipoprotein diacylglyceryl transferase